MNAFYLQISRFFATLFFIGYIPFAPGTLGSLFAVAFIWILKPNISLHIIIVVIGFFIGIISSEYAERYFDKEDCSYIVIDEFIGYLVSVLFIPLTFNYLIGAFFLFRFLDILKPVPIRYIERTFKGGLAIMMDDIAAGIITNIILQVVITQI